MPKSEEEKRRSRISSMKRLIVAYLLLGILIPILLCILLFIKVDRLQKELDQVQLMTLHASKGLEFPYVYLVGMEEGLLPHQSSIDEDNVDEERRLAYVGITRAQKELTFTLCKERRQYGEVVRPEPSRFLLELPQDDLILEQARKVITAEERMHKGQANVANIRAMLAKAKEKG